MSHDHAKNAIYLNGKIYTVSGTDWDQDPQESIVVEHGIIKYVGTNHKARQFNDSSKKYLFILYRMTAV